MLIIFYGFFNDIISLQTKVNVAPEKTGLFYCIIHTKITNTHIIDSPLANFLRIFFFPRVFILFHLFYCSCTTLQKKYICGKKKPNKKMRNFPTRLYYFKKFVL